MDKIKIDSEQLNEILKHFHILVDNIKRDEGNNINYNCMKRLENKINDRKNIILEELFMDKKLFI